MTYNYDGIAIVKCSVCDIEYIVKFWGNEKHKPSHYVREEMKILGWDVVNKVCPHCRTEKEE